jgi:hypothetical protein
MSTTPDDSSTTTSPTPAPEAVSIQLDPVTEAALALVIARSALSPRRSPLTHDQALAQAVREGARILAEGVLREWGWGRCHTRHVVDAPPPLPDASETTGPIAATAQLDTLTKAALCVVMTRYAYGLEKVVALAAYQGARALGLGALPQPTFWDHDDDLGAAIIAA